MSIGEYYRSWQSFLLRRTYSFTKSFTMKTSFWQRGTLSLVWPVPALLVWGGAWLLFVGGQRWLPWWAAAGWAVVFSIGASLWGGTWWRRALLALGFPLSFAVLVAGSLPGWGWLLLLGGLLLVYPLNAWRDAPVFPTPAGALDGLAQVLPLPAGARVLDAGCGLGHGLCALHQAWPQVQLHGVEWSWVLRWIGALRCPWARVRQGDMWAIDWSGYDLVYLFQRPESMTRAAVKSLTEMSDGAWLVSLNFPLDDVQPTHCLPLPDGRHVYAYRCPIASVDRQSVQDDARAAVQWADGVPPGGLVRGERVYPIPSRPGGRRRTH